MIVIRRSIEMRVIVYRGTTWQRSNTKQFVKWYVDEFIPERVQEKLFLQIYLSTKDNDDLRGDCGICEYFDEDRDLGWEHCKIIIRAPTNIMHFKFLTRLAHECVHVKQYTTHELISYGHHSMFRKIKYDDKINDPMWRTPWEIDALGSEFYLVNEYALKYDLCREIFTPTINRALC